MRGAKRSLLGNIRPRGMSDWPPMNAVSLLPSFVRLLHCRMTIDQRRHEFVPQARVQGRVRG